MTRSRGFQRRDGSQTGTSGPAPVLLLVCPTRPIKNRPIDVSPDSRLHVGIDMTNAFLTHLIGEEVTKKIRGIVELSEREQYDDEFAVIHGLV